ncbi:MAG: hypothetical protein LOY58_13460 [Gammaproteobacteria bacterium]|nr:hypothetical protein [Gammaproteobacteria bacterium]
MPDRPRLLAYGLLAGLGAHSAAWAADAPPAAGRFLEVCFQHGCASTAIVPLDERILAELGGIFASADDGAQERAAIARGIAVVERYVGSRTGTDRDLGGTFPGAFRQGQMDCIDESTNTTRYLRLFEREGWLRRHDVAMPATRLPIPAGWWPHTTAVVTERGTGTAFAVDSWFEANGHPPYIVELGAWRRGWKPARANP